MDEKVEFSREIFRDVLEDALEVVDEKVDDPFEVGFPVGLFHEVGFGVDSFSDFDFREVDQPPRGEEFLQHAVERLTMPLFGLHGGGEVAKGGFDFPSIAVELSDFSVSKHPHGQTGRKDIILFGFGISDFDEAHVDVLNGERSVSLRR